MTWMVLSQVRRNMAPSTTRGWSANLRPNWRQTKALSAVGIKRIKRMTLRVVRKRVVVFRLMVESSGW